MKSGAASRRRVVGSGTGVDRRLSIEMVGVPRAEMVKGTTKWRLKDIRVHGVSRGMLVTTAAEDW